MSEFIFGKDKLYVLKKTKERAASSLHIEFNAAL